MVFIAGILCCQGKVAEIDNEMGGSEKPHNGKIFTLLGSSVPVAFTLLNPNLGILLRLCCGLPIDGLSVYPLS